MIRYVLFSANRIGLAGIVIILCFNAGIINNFIGYWEYSVFTRFVNTCIAYCVTCIFHLICNPYHVCKKAEICYEFVMSKMYSTNILYRNKGPGACVVRVYVMYSTIRCPYWTNGMHVIPWGFSLTHATPVTSSILTVHFYMLLWNYSLQTRNTSNLEHPIPWYNATEKHNEVVFIFKIIYVFFNSV